MASARAMISMTGCMPKVRPTALTSRKSVVPVRPVVPRQTARLAIHNRQTLRIVAKDEEAEEKPEKKAPKIKGAVSSDEEGFKVIGKAEIPALVPRGDFLDQLLKWSIMEFEENGRKRYGTKMIVDICDEYVLEDGTPTAFAIKMKRPEGGDDLHIEVCMDDQKVEVEKTLEGFGKEKDAEAEENPFARAYEVIGKNLIIRRKEGPLEEDLRPMVAKVLSALSKSVNTYYAFGSVYVDDAT
eukprot:CAMPEP_0118933576 /NCGR_PEP_ID=MMETSP1169-20130426/12067_1 /TAXON_ID=36882 /ORGANISM="Pyramimonas obovata, Strain CCMP722" /LENGTH=240 /DNA_ID=CAMNT_0006876359 /DNA_START=68 /DNA_END=790 /DNA_ORIENTATION=+